MNHHSGRTAMNRRLLGAGIAGLVAAFTVAPMAHAASTVAAPASETATPEGTSSQSSLQAVPSDTSVSEAPTPDYGFQKIRLGVQVKDGSWVPDGTTTVGSEITITEVDPDAPDEDPWVTTCRTDPSTVAPDSTATYCVFNRASIAAADPSPDVDPDAYYTAEPGYRVIVTQTSVNANLLIDTQTQTIEPCVLDDDVDGPLCSTQPHIVFNDPGKGPTAKNDTATTAAGQSVTVDVLLNDDTWCGAPGSLVNIATPGHGTAAVSTASGPALTTDACAPAVEDEDQDPDYDDLVQDEGDDLVNLQSGKFTLGLVAAPAATRQMIRYTPSAGFSGTDSFRYTLQTPNGTATALVTITVSAPIATPTPTTAPLAATGPHTGSLLGLALALLIAGGATLVGTRRRRPRHDN